MVEYSFASRHSLLPDLGPVLAAATTLDFGLVEISEDLSAVDAPTLESVRRQLVLSRKRIGLLDSPIPVADRAAYRYILRHAALLGVERVKVPSRGISSPDSLREVCRMGRAYGIRILLENEGDGPLSTEPGLSELLRSLGPESAGWILDPLGFVRQRLHPFFQVFYTSKLKNDVALLRIRDGRFEDGAGTLPGQGDGEIKELVSILLAHSFRGPFSFSPDGSGLDPEDCRESLRVFLDMLLSL